MKATLLRILPLLLLAGCGDGGNWTDETADTQLPTQGFRAEDALDRTAGARSIPPVHVLRQSGSQKGKYTYRIQSEEYQENDFLGLCSSMARDNPDLKLRIVPGVMLTQDEIGLVQARIRETGISDIAVLDSVGKER